jgi:hypothetical protein
MYNPFQTNVYEAERYTNGEWFFKLFDRDTEISKIRSEKERLEAVLSNPAALKVFKLQCDLFSLGKLQAVRNNEIIEDDLLIKRLRYPNPYQSQRQFLWDYMFWNMLGTAYLYRNSNVITDSTKLYFLDPTRFQWTDDILFKLDKIVLSKKTFNDYENLTIQYHNLDGTVTIYKLAEIMPFFDLSNGIGNWYRGNSTIDALYKVIYNSEKSLDAKGINLEFSGKYMVSGQHKDQDIYGVPMSKDEQRYIEKSTRKNKPVHAVKSMLDIKRFVENIDKLKLDNAYREDYFTIGNMFGIPRDVLEAFNSSTYENQEKARGAHIEYCLQPKGNDLVDGLEKMFGYTEQDIDIQISWSHLSFMQVFGKERADVKHRKMETLKMVYDMGVVIPDLNERVTDIIDGDGY